MAEPIKKATIELTQDEIKYVRFALEGDLETLRDGKSYITEFESEIPLAEQVLDKFRAMEIKMAEKDHAAN